MMQDAAQNAATIPPEKLGQAALLTMIVAIIALLMLVGIISIAMRRRRARMRADRSRPHGRRMDPWVVAGQRAPTPTAEQLERQSGEEP